MVISSWLWLNEAADLIASRLIAAEPQKFVNPATALEEARSELLDQANRGALEVQGKWFQIEQYPELSPRDWEVLSSEYWDVKYRLASYGHLNAHMTVDWDENYLGYEDTTTENCGYSKLRVRSEKIDHLWPATPSSKDIYRAQLEKPALDTMVKHPGGAPRKFRDDLFIEIIRVAKLLMGCPRTSQNSYVT